VPPPAPVRRARKGPAAHRTPDRPAAGHGPDHRTSDRPATGHDPDHRTSDRPAAGHDPAHRAPDPAGDGHDPAGGFAGLGLSGALAATLAARGYTQPTPIQAMAIPVVLEGRDVFGCAQTGTGKTAAFALPILQALARDAHAGGPGPTGPGRKTGSPGRAPRALVLCPTRELAAQIHDAFIAYGRGLPLRHAVIYGGVGQRGQERALRAGVDALIATPGRLLDLHAQGLVDLGRVRTLVLDEADRMLDMGFLPDMRRIAALTPADRQTLLFSATASGQIVALAEGLLRDPAQLRAARESTTAAAVEQRVYMVLRQDKPALLGELLGREGVGRMLVFTRTKHGADKVVRQLERRGVVAAAIHGNKSQNARTRALEGFKRSGRGVLVATDVASRGIDVRGITHVVNYDLPADAEAYVHRVGRTARAGMGGVAITFCDAAEPKELRDLAGIERRTGVTIDTATDAGQLCHDRPQPARKPATASRKPGPGSRKNAPASGGSGPGPGGNRPETGGNRPETGRNRPGSGRNRPGSGRNRPGSGRNAPGAGRAGPGRRGRGR